MASITMSAPTLFHEINPGSLSEKTRMGVPSITKLGFAGFDFSW
jgi:hypothetical protein